MNLNEAKKLYFKWRCSTFDMAREDFAYNEFRDLLIPKETRDEWSTEYLTIALNDFRKSASIDDFFKVNSAIGNHHTEKNLKLLVDSLRSYEQLGNDIAIFICDNILGMRNLRIRCGYLDYAMDCGNKEIYDQLYQYAKAVLQTRTPAENQKARFESMKEVLSQYPSHL